MEINAVSLDFPNMKCKFRLFANSAASHIPVSRSTFDMQFKIGKAICAVACQAKVQESVGRYSEAVAGASDDPSRSITVLASCIRMLGVVMALGFSGLVSAGMPESPYELLAATGDGIVLSIKDRVRLEEEFIPIMERNRKQLAIDKWYRPLPERYKNVVARSYEIIKSKGFEDKKLASGLSSVSLGLSGIQAAKVFLDTWERTNKVPADMRATLIVPNLEPWIEAVPELGKLFDLAELQEIDRQLQKVFEMVIAQNRQETAQTRQETARLKENIRKLESLLKNY